MMMKPIGLVVLFAALAASAGIREMKEEFEKNLPKTVESAKLAFVGVEAGYDVYNCSIPFEWRGTRYIFGRVEPHDKWAASKVYLFRESGRDRWNRVLEFGSLDLEDPYIAFVKGELIVGGTRVQKVGGAVKSYRGDFYRDNGRGPLHLEYYTSGPFRMKDIRLVELKDGRIGVFSRPRGEAVKAKYGSDAVIGFTTIADLAELTPELVENAPVVEGIFGKDEWGGCNQAYLLADGTVLVAGHLCYRGEEVNGIPRQIYCNAAFTLDPATGCASHIRIVATRRMYPACEPKVPHLDDCVFTSGFVFNGDGTADIYTGLCDAGEGRVRVKAADLTAVPPKASGREEKFSDPVVVAPRDPTAVWNRAELYKTPRTWAFQDPFKGEATPIWIEGEPWKGQPTKCFAFADRYARGGADVVRVGEGMVKDGAVTVKFAANGRKVVRAELLSTRDGKDVKWDKRAWTATPAEGFGAASGTVTAKLPSGAFAWIVNLVTDDGLVASSPYREAE